MKVKSRKGGRTMNFSSKKGFGVNEIIGIAAGVIIAVLIVVPGLRSFASSVMQELSDWWRGIADSLFTG